ncbi:MAG: hypothetical protein MZV49_06920 [Rhodopseudomonas palustris]|nr:hypothetical protein [Rhodopseudomonas palustris]
MEVDWGRRFDHMQQHTGQHLLTAVAEQRFGWHTTAFHLGEQSARTSSWTRRRSRPTSVAELEDAVAAEVRAARPVTARRVSPAGVCCAPGPDARASRGLRGRHPARGDRRGRPQHLRRDARAEHGGDRGR